MSVQDANGNVVTGSSASVTLSISTNPGLAILSGTTTVTAVNGVASFPGVKMDTAGTGYRLTASATGMVSAVSNAFNISVGPATQIGFLVQPTTTPVSTAMNPSVTVAAQDDGGNKVTSFNAPVALAITPGTGTPAAVFVGQSSATPSAGVASFPGLGIATPGTGYTLTASGGGLRSGVSRSFDIVQTGAAVKLQFTSNVAPAPAAGSTFSVSVDILTAAGTLVTNGASTTVTISLAPASAAGPITGTLTTTTQNGRALFSNLRIDKAGLYVLAASSPGLTSAISNSFSVTAGSANALAFTKQPPTSVTAGIPLPPVEVSFVDAYGNIASPISGTSIDVKLSTNPGGDNLPTVTVAPAASGTATFPAIRLRKAGTGYRLSATTTAGLLGIQTAISDAFDILPAPTVALVFTASPTVTTMARATISQPFQVHTIDSTGNLTASGATRDVALSIESGPIGGTLTGTTSQPIAADGSASFNALQLSKVGAYTLRASSASLTSAVSPSINIGPGLAAAPVITGITPGPSQLSIAFTAPVDDGGGAISNYQYSTDDGVTWTTRAPASTASPLVVTGLVNGTSYSVKLRAVNVSGNGLASNALLGAPATTPGAPTIAVTPGNAQATVDFTAPTSNGGASISNYEYSLDGGTTWTARSPSSVTSPLLLTGLQNGTTYSVKLRAINVIGSGDPSAAASVVPRTTPGAPTIVTITPANSQATVNFTAPSSNGGASITNYEYSTNAGSTWAAFNPPVTSGGQAIITGLSNGAVYHVQLRAINAAGAGPASNDVVANLVCPASSVAVGQTVSGVVQASDNCQVAEFTYADRWQITLASSTRVQFDMTSTQVNAFLILTDGTQTVRLATDDNSGGGTNARITADLTAGTYYIWTTTRTVGESGTYQLQVTAVPDPLVVAFMSVQSGHYNIYSVRVDGTNLTRLTNGTSDDVSPRWSPDGSKIAFVRNGTPWIMNADGSSPHAVSALGAVGSLSWSPDGRKFAYDANVNNYSQVFVADTGGTNVTQLTFADSNSFFPRWSPNGGRIMFTRNPGVAGQACSGAPPCEVYAMNANGSGVNRITTSGANTQAGYAFWKPDGTKIGFSAFDYVPGSARTFVANSDGSGAVQVTSSGVGGFDWSSDGTKIAGQLSSGSSVTMYLMNPDGTGQVAIPLGSLSTDNRQPALRPVATSSASSVRIPRR